MGAILAFLLVLAGAFTLFVSGVAVNGLVLSVLWGWFMVPAFGLPPLGIAMAVGIAMTVRWVTWQVPGNKSDAMKAIEEETDNWEKLKMGLKEAAKPFFRALGVLAIGWLVHLFV